MTGERPIVSVLVPCYNCEDFIRDTLQAVIDQTFSEWECVVVDDASTDASAEIVAKMAAEEPRFQLLRLDENRGAAGARNAGLQEIRGDYVAFLDSDDYWVPEKLELQLEHARRTGAAIVHSSYRFVDKHDNFLRGGVLASDSVDLHSYLRNTEIGMSTAIIDIRETGRICLREIRVCQDTNLWLELLSQGFVARGIPEVLVHYRIREGQISGSKFGMAKQVFALYCQFVRGGWLGAIVPFSCYAVNGVMKRLRSPAFPTSSDEEAGSGKQCS